ncbi:hypothetical protein [Streptomyces sp. NBC_00083]|uniref:hypothetical protein n=1 Tax=Streptomyces sp. NBC_00083 TaxID=2975647 RepID=UPI0022580CC4|nr:hypothetical protein [Streptomyces sp. NBC_00083]MCX5385881.1 hypothetical protein [Streptomyces sp. NBC_00083]
MDSDLQELSGHLRKRGLRVELDAAGFLRAGTSVNDLVEEIAMAGVRYITALGHEIGEQGREATCAERVAHLLAAPVQTGPRDRTS